MTGRSAADAASGHSPEGGAAKASPAKPSVPNAFADLMLAEQEAMREATGLKDWHYRDLPQLAPEFFDQFIELCGKDNLRWITVAQRPWPDGSITKRGQVMISPDGMARLAAHNAASAGEARSDAAPQSDAAEGKSAAPKADAP